MRRCDREARDLIRFDDEGQTTGALILAIVIRGVVVDVAMQQPLTGLARFPDHVVTLPGMLPVLLGLASLVFPVDSSLAVAWAVAAIAWGVVFVAAAELTKGTSPR